MKWLFLTLFFVLVISGVAFARPLGKDDSIPPDDGPYGYKGTTYAHSTKRGLWLGGPMQNITDWVFYRVNFAKLGHGGPHTPLCTSGCSNLVFVRCNLLNVDVPADSIIDGGQIAHIEEKNVEIMPNVFEKHRIVEGGDNVTRTYRVYPENVVTSIKDGPVIFEVSDGVCNGGRLVTSQAASFESDHRGLPLHVVGDGAFTIRAVMGPNSILLDSSCSPGSGLTFRLHEEDEISTLPEVIQIDEKTTPGNKRRVFVRPPAR